MWWCNGYQLFGRAHRKTGLGREKLEGRPCGALNMSHTRGLKRSISCFLGPGISRPVWGSINHCWGGFRSSIDGPCPPFGRQDEALRSRGLILVHSRRNWTNAQVSCKTQQGFDTLNKFQLGDRWRPHTDGELRRKSGVRMSKPKVRHPQSDGVKERLGWSEELRGRPCSGSQELVS